MNVSWRTASVCARISRANPGITTIAIARIAFSSPATEDPDDREREHQRREARQAVHDPHEDVVGAATAEARRAARCGTATSSARTTIWNPELQRHRAAVDDAAERVAPEAVGAERCVPDSASRERSRDPDLVRGRAARRAARTRRRTMTSRRNAERDDRRLVAEQPPERAPPRARRAASPTTASSSTMPASSTSRGIAREVARANGRDTRCAHETRTHSRVEEAVADVDDQVQHHVDHDEGERDRLDHRHVGQRQRPQHVGAEAGDREDLLDDDDTTEQPAELQAEDRDRGDGRVLERVLHDGLPRAGADRERGPHVVRLEHIDDRGAHLPRDRCAPRPGRARPPGG